MNVNSIAPGVAAALLATAAGLLVAIPALFGYNIILTRIKRINATSRIVDGAQYQRRLDEFDFDMISRAMSGSAMGEKETSSLVAAC